MVCERSLWSSENEGRPCTGDSIDDDDDEAADAADDDADTTVAGCDHGAAIAADGLPWTDSCCEAAC